MVVMFEGVPFGTPFFVINQNFFFSNGMQMLVGIEMVQERRPYLSMRGQWHDQLGTIAILNCSGTIG